MSTWQVPAVCIQTQLKIRILHADFQGILL